MGTTSSKIKLQFEEPADPKGSIEFYQLLFCEIDNCTMKLKKLYNSSKEIEIPNLNPCTTYKVSLRAVNVDFDGSEFFGQEISVDLTTGAIAPSEPLILPINRTEVTTFYIRWSEEQSKCQTNYTVTATPISNCHHTPISKSTDENFLEIKGLRHYTKYKIVVEGKTINGSALSTEVTEETGYNQAKALPVANINCSSENCTFTWNISHLAGPTELNVTIKDSEENKKGNCQTNLLTALDNSSCNSRMESCTIYHLKPYMNYSYLVHAFVNDTEDVLEGKTFRTEPFSPTEPTNFSVHCDVGKIKWAIPDILNGELENFILQYDGYRPEKDNHTDLMNIPAQESLNLYNKTVILRPEYHYSFQIRAKTKNVATEGPEVRISCTTKAKAPKANNESINIESNTKLAKILLTKRMFSDDNGNIVNYSVILYEDDDNPDLSHPLLWHSVVKAEKIKPYRTTPDNWNPFLQNVSNDMCCQGDDNSVECQIGCNENCYSQSMFQYNKPCNGPLRSNTFYKIFIRAYTAAAYGDTKALKFSTGATDAASKADATLAVTIVFLGIIIAIGFFVYYRRNAVKLFLRLKPRIIISACDSSNLSLSTENVVIENQSSARPVKLEDFLTHYKDMSRDSGLKFSQEYEELKALSPNFPQTAAQLADNRPKNRWINILPFDHSRVKLLPNSDDISTDYINACYIPGFNSQREYIATQGPLPSTKDDFWRMVWEQSCQMIVMVTQCVERGKIKCETYWPEDRDLHYFADISIRLRSESILSNFTIRIFDLHMGTKTMEVKQMHFTKWPDFGCPENTDLLINFIQAVREHTPHGFTGPFIIHCSAGVGRTGTYIAVDRLMQHIHHHASVDIYGLVLEMRQFRMNMVQTEDQYIYIHSCLRDILSNSSASEPLYANVIKVPLIDSQL